MMRQFDNAALSTTERVWPILVAIGLAGALLTLFLWNPATTALFPPCPFRALTGYHCAGCGSLRAMHQLLHVQFGNAVRLNPLMVVSLPLLGYAVLAMRWRQIRFGWIERVTAHAAWPQLILAIIVLYWGLRNVPFAPFSWLAPQPPLP